MAGLKTRKNILFIVLLGFFVFFLLFLTSGKVQNFFLKKCVGDEIGINNAFIKEVKSYRSEKAYPVPSIPDVMKLIIQKNTKNKDDIILFLKRNDFDCVHGALIICSLKVKYLQKPDRACYAKIVDTPVRINEIEVAVIIDDNSELKVNYNFSSSN